MSAHAPSDSAAAAPRLACAVCRSPNLTLTRSQDALACASCTRLYPVSRCGEVDIPWLFADPIAARLEWRARYNGFLHGNDSTQDRLRAALKEGVPDQNQCARMSRMLEARKRHRLQVGAILAPLGLEEIDWPADAIELLDNKLPANQGLSSYATNVFRDWAWDNGETEAQLAAVERVLSADWRGRLGATLTLGAGGCRLPYELHRRGDVSTSVVLDINPLLLKTACDVVQGKRVTLSEFPVAPLDGASFAVEQPLQAPERLGAEDLGRFRFVLADALTPPFESASFDTVLTPWLVDILPTDPRDLMASINDLLPLDGVWVNTGSLAFFHADPTWCLSEDEFMCAVERTGFEILAVDRHEIPYLMSPHSSHGRIERILTFAARKIRSVPRPKRDPYLPEWLRVTCLPVPRAGDIVNHATNNILIAEVLSAVDGKLSIDAIVGQIAARYELGTEETLLAVRRILTDHWEGSVSVEWLEQ